MFAKFKHLLTRKTKNPPVQQPTAETFNQALFIFQTKIFFEFTDLTAKPHHKTYKKKLFASFKENPPLLDEKNFIVIPFKEKEFVKDTVRRIPDFIQQAVDTCLDKQFEHIASAKRTIVTERLKDYWFTSMNQYTMFRVDLEYEEYKQKQLYALSPEQMNTLLDTLFEIEQKVNQLGDSEAFILTFIDTLHTLNETTDKLTAYKNYEAILAILRNMKQTAESMIDADVKTARELSTLEVNKQTNADLIIQMELDFTKTITEKNQKIEALKQQQEERGL